MNYKGFTIIRLWRRDICITLPHLGHLISNSAWSADNISINLVFEQTGHLIFAPMVSHLLFYKFNFLKITFYVITPLLSFAFCYCLYSIVSVKKYKGLVIGDVSHSRVI